MFPDKKYEYKQQACGNDATLAADLLEPFHHRHGTYVVTDWALHPS
jgi:hypothetical protein